MDRDTLIIGGVTVTVDSVEAAFPGSELVAVSSDPGPIPVKDRPWSDSKLNSTLVVVLVLVSIIFLRNILSALPPVIRSLTRTRGPFNLESSLRSSKDRNILALLLFMPFAMVVSCYRIWDPAFARDWSDEVHLGLVSGAFLAFILVRMILCYELRSRRINADSYSVANRFGITYFIVIAAAALITAGIMSVLGVSDLSIRNTLRWLLAALYLIFLIRKFNIFNSFCSPFISFLYLCGLEILPMGLLISAAIFF